MWRGALFRARSGALTGAASPSPEAQAKFGRIADAALGSLRDWIEFPMRYANAKAALDAGALPEQLAPVGLEQSREQLGREAEDWARSTALGMVGASRLPGAAPEGALGAAGGKLKQPEQPLPMDEASRMARAGNMGFYMGHPLAHGTAGPEFRFFDQTKAGATSGAEPSRMGVWSEWHPEGEAGIADRFASNRAEQTGDDPHVKPLVHRAENPAALTLRGDETNAQIAATLMDAWDAGHDSVLLRNYTAHGGKSGAVLVVKDPAQLRSPYAQFDWPHSRAARSAPRPSPTFSA